MIRLRSDHPHPTPLGAAGRGLVAGFGASVVLSVLARCLPGMSNRPPNGDGEKNEPPDDPFDHRQVEEWQARGQAPAALEPPPPTANPTSTGGAPGPTPAAALTLPEAPGPEGLAEQFAFKVASGVFGRDISHALRPAGLVAHLTYGSLWGMLFGLIQGTHRRRVLPFGMLYGLAVWLAGPAALVPAMKLMRPPWEEPPVRAAMMVLGHIAYGLAVAAAYEALEPEG